MATRWTEQARGWSRTRFVTANVLVGLWCVILLVLDGISAAVHFHVGVALFGVAVVAVLVLWFRVIEARMDHFRGR